MRLWRMWWCCWRRFREGERRGRRRQYRFSRIFLFSFLSLPRDATDSSRSEDFTLSLRAVAQFSEAPLRRPPSSRIASNQPLCHPEARAFCRTTKLTGKTLTPKILARRNPYSEHSDSSGASVGLSKSSL